MRATGLEPVTKGGSLSLPLITIQALPTELRSHIVCANCCISSPVHLQEPHTQSSRMGLAEEVGADPTHHISMT